MVYFGEFMFKNLEVMFSFKKPFYSQMCILLPVGLLCVHEYTFFVMFCIQLHTIEVIIDWDGILQEIFNALTKTSY